MKNNKILLTIIAIILLLAITSAIYFTLKSPTKKLNQQTQVIPTDAQTLAQQSPSTTPTFDPSLPHISSTTNIIEMFGITKDTKATITKGVVVDWAMEDSTATQTLAKIVIQPEQVLGSDFETYQTYGELKHGKYILKWLNYSLDTGEEFQTFSEGYHTSILVSYDTESGQEKVVYHKIDLSDKLNSTTLASPFVSSSTKSISFFESCYGFCSHIIIDKDMVFVPINRLVDVYKIKDNNYYAIIRSDLVLQPDLVGLPELYKIVLDQDGKIVEDKKIFSSELDPKIYYSYITINKYIDGKFYFYDNAESKADKIKLEYYYDEATDKVVKIK